MPRVSKVSKAVGAMRALAGVVKHFEQGQRYPLGGETYTRDEIVAVFQAQLDAIKQVDATRAAATAAVANERAAAARAHELTHYLKMAVEGRFGPSANAWADFGWEAPKKRGPKTLQGKVEGAHKARATRVARHTMGKRQRRKIKG
ncbi:MAG TPA: hypothetical protein VKU41_32225 [Polyangiaceae bacterium]|nr:hypothetical protein [Polyangiaceae bacterium]